MRLKAKKDNNYFGTMLVVVLQKFQNASFKNEQFANENDFKIRFKFSNNSIKSKLFALNLE